MAERKERYREERKLIHSRGIRRREIRQRPRTRIRLPVSLTK